VKSTNPHGGGRPARRRAHHRCPYQAYFPDGETAQEEAARLGSRIRPCTRCRGYHLTL
jgi:hypothetical protein